MDEPEDLQEGEEESSRRGGSNRLLLIMLIVNTVGLIALAVLFVLRGGDGAQRSGDVANGAMDDSQVEGMPRAGKDVGPMVELGTMVVNLAEPTADRLLKVSLHLELDDESTREEVEARRQQIKYQLQLLLSGQRVASVTGPENIERLRKQMTRRANAVLSKGRVVGVWPAEWIVQ